MKSPIAHDTRPAAFDRQVTLISELTPVDGQRMDSPATIPNDLYNALKHVTHDVGGQGTTPVLYREREEEDWEKNTYLTCECLGWRGKWNSEMRRRAENDLGATEYFGFPYYGRWATVAARVMVEYGHITVDELGAKIDEVRARLNGKKKS